MKLSNFWLLLMLATNISPMERSPLPANYEITTLADEVKIYKCLLCDHRPVKRETSFLNHWVQAHNKTFDYTMEIWKEIYEKCTQCPSYHNNPKSLKLHILRNHKKSQKDTIKLLEKNAIFKLYIMSQPI